MIVDCPFCRNPFQAVTSQPQNWCPHCGAEVALSKPDTGSSSSGSWAGVPGAPVKNAGASGSFRAPRPAEAWPAVASATDSRSSHPSLSSSTSKSAARPARSGRETMEWFHCRIKGWFGCSNVMRAYVTGTDIIFVNMGVATHRVDTHAQQMTAAMGGGGIPALLAVTLAHNARAKFEKMEKALRNATPDRLREYVQGDKSCLILQLNEISAPRIEKSSFWSRLNGPHKAVLHFNHVGKGKMSLEILEREDIGKAVPAFVRHFQEDFKIDMNWRDAL